MEKKISLKEAISMAVGTMIGASIFSIFGLGAKIAGHNLPFVFVLSGFLALLVAYSYATLGARIVSDAGPIAFILKAFGDNVFAGTFSILMWLSYVVSIAMFSKGFAGYFLPLVGIDSDPFNIAIVEVLIISFFVVLNFMGSKAVGRAEFYIVLVKVSILGVFIVLGIFSINPEWIIPSFGASGLKNTLFASVVFFLSYMGFGLVTNASEHIEDPTKNVPLAIYISIIIVSIIYVGVASVAVGNLPLDKLISSSENALAVASKPFLGNFGFFLVSLGAVFSISSALNATLYGGANVAYSLAKNGELPEFFERKVWFNSSEGLYITAVLSMVFAVFFNMNGIASITSGVFIAIYIAVILSHYRLSDEFGGNKLLILFNLIVLVLVFITLLYYQWKTQRDAFWGFVITFGGAFILEFIYRAFLKERRVFKILEKIEEDIRKLI